MLNLSEIKPAIENICRSLPVKRLGIFGSALTINFKPDSDLDILVIFDANQKIDTFNAYFELKEQLEKLFNRKVDLTVDKAFKNPVFRKSVENTRTVIYER
jgi:uncharacterized protein